MRISHALLVAACLLTLSTFVTAPSVRANPAEPYASTYCDPTFTDASGNVWQDCYANRGVTQLTLLPSGDYKYTSNGTVTATTTVNGVVTYSDASTYQFTDVFKSGELHVSRSYFVTVIASTDASGEVTTCTLKSNVVVVEGVARADIYSFECSD
jgi:hypothetical protein